MSAPLPSALILYWCPPYSCSMPKRKCETNRARRAVAKKQRMEWGKPDAEALAAVGLEPCDACPGVEALAEAGGRQPRPASDLSRIDSKPEARVPLRRSGRRIGSNIGHNAERRLGVKEDLMGEKTPPRPAGEKYRNLFPSAGTIVYRRVVKGKLHQISTGTRSWDEAAAKRDAYEREHRLLETPVRANPKREAPAPELESAIAHTTGVRSIQRNAPPAPSPGVALEKLVRDLRAKRDALLRDLEQVNGDLATLERAQQLLGGAAA